MRASSILGKALAAALASGSILVAHAAEPAAWLDSALAREFRDRVVLLALIYGDSSGIDPQGYLVRTRQVRKIDAECADVEVVTLQGTTEVRREQVRACKHG